MVGAARRGLGHPMQGPLGANADHRVGSHSEGTPAGWHFSSQRRARAGGYSSPGRMGSHSEGRQPASTLAPSGGRGRADILHQLE